MKRRGRPRENWLYAICTCHRCGFSGMGRLDANAADAYKRNELVCAKCYAELQGAAPQAVQR